MNEKHPIKAYREKNDLSQAEIAETLGVTQGIIWKWEAGKSDISAERAILIEEKLGKELPAEKLSTTLQQYESIKAKRKTARKGKNHATK